MGGMALRGMGISNFIALLFAVAAALAVAGGDASSALAQSTNANKSAANSQRDKKPAETCKDMDKKSKAYSDCVKTQAQTTKTDKQADKQVPKGADKAKVKKPD